VCKKKKLVNFRKSKYINKKKKCGHAKKKLIEEKKHVKIIDHEKLHFNWEIGKTEQFNINAGERDY
jgi:hypothetical protein